MRRGQGRTRAVLAALGALIAMISAAPSPATGSGFTSPNVEYLSTIPFDAGGAAGARIVGKHLYVAGLKALSIYDISVPEDPQLLSQTPLPAYFANEDVDTNGRILLLSSDSTLDELYVYDVEDKESPQLVSTVSNVIDHNFACVFDCRWAYGARGAIVDLRDPANAKLVSSWGGGVNPADGFDTDEVAPGRILTATRLIRLLDARKDPKRPVTLAAGFTEDNRLIHSVGWPRRMKDRFILVQGETPISVNCKETSGAFMTWDASKWRKTGEFRMIDEFRVVNGTMVDGNPPANALGCTAMWFDEHPDFRNGGLVVSGFFEHGARFLDVSPDGKIEEVGYFTPAGGATYATYWANDEIVYAIDIVRGIDILRFNG